MGWPDMWIGELTKHNLCTYGNWVKEDCLSDPLQPHCWDFTSNGDDHFPINRSTEWVCVCVCVCVWHTHIMQKLKLHFCKMAEILSCALNRMDLKLDFKQPGIYAMASRGCKSVKDGCWQILFSFKESIRNMMKSRCPIWKVREKVYVYSIGTQAQQALRKKV
jgi:hypothetical protein